MNTIYSADTFRSIFDALPSPVFVVDGDVMVHDFNTAAAEFLLCHLTDLNGLSYSVQNDLAANGMPVVQWQGLFCRDSFIGNAVKEAVHGHHVVRRYMRLKTHREGYRTELETRIKCSPFQNGTRTQVLLVFEEMRQLGGRRGVIHICSVCHRVINKTQALAQLEAYAKECTAVDFSHGLCSQCYRVEMAKVKAYPFGEPVIPLVKNNGCNGSDKRRNCR